MDRREPILKIASPADAEAAELIGELNGLLDGLYHPDDNHFALDPSDVAGDSGAFLLARLGGDSLCLGKDL